MEIESTKLFKTDKAQYGDNYNAHYLEQYKLYVEMADRISNRRVLANAFFLPINTVIISLIGYLSQTGAAHQWLYWVSTVGIGVAGVLLCYVWYRLILSYKGMNAGKFEVIHALEQRLPAALYEVEWEVLKEGKNSKVYRPFTEVEMVVPWIFMALYLLLLALPLVSLLFNGQ